MASLRDICLINPDSIDVAKVFADQSFEYIDIASIQNETGDYLGGTIMLGTEAPSRARRKVQHLDVLLSTVRPNLRAFSLLRKPAVNAIASTGFAVLRAKPDLVLPGYLIWLLRCDICVEQMVGMSGKGAYPSINSSDVESISIPLPPLEVQHQIVAEIEGYQKIIDGARQVLDNYKPRIAVSPDWPLLALGEICADFSNGVNFASEQIGRGTKFVNIKDVFSDGYVDLTTLGRVELSQIEVARKQLKQDDLLFVRSSVKEAGVGFPSLAPSTDEDVVFCGFLIKCSPIVNIVDPAYLLWLLRTPDFRDKVVARSNRANITNISQDALKTLPIPLPDFPTQRAIVAEIEAEQALVNANRELIRRMQARVKAAIDRVWGAP